MPRYPRISDTPDKFDSLGDKLCRNCDNLIGEGRRHYCSKICMDEFNRNNSWFWVRKDVLRRDKYRCSICKKRFRKAGLEVDHIIPIQMGGKLFEKANLRTLCKECHKSKSKLDRDALSD
ncbi:HNH endonuclease [archaeon]|jgi:5-methylcytosine-specific restriction enzyme A|nr:HNH endonuclease [archaeon]MBT4351944.1 HNH endonuclease [archaeon]MBT4646673.1 HNH endonuclease [archaeon]MBT6821877.1 HNH endonuclease [archaeon]MBT7392287.1 HNH endonuclease [archaeon]